MDKKIAIIISPNWRNYAKKYIDPLIDSLRKQNYSGGIKIFITDNETSEESYKFLRSKLAEAVIHRNITNDGYAKGCNDCLKLALAEGFEYFYIVNIHNVLMPDCLTQVMKVLQSNEKIGLVQARLMLDKEKTKISSLGNATHFLGFGYCVGYQEEYQATDNKMKPIHYPSGSSILTTKKVLEKIGLFDEEYWMYNEDQELGWKAWIAGYECVLAPKAVQYNKYEFQRSIKKFYWMDRNRILAIVQCYHILTLLLILPAFVIMELGLILFSLKTGWFKEKLKVWGYFLSPSKWLYIIKKRREIQKLRRVKDREISDLITGKIWYQEVADWKLKLINPFFNLYWKIVKKIMIW